MIRLLQFFWSNHGERQLANDLWSASPASGRPEQPWCVPLQKRERERHLVLGPLAAWLPSGPQLQISWVVVEPVSVAMMDGLIREEGPAQQLRHDEAVLECGRIAVGEVP